MSKPDTPHGIMTLKDVLEQLGELVANKPITAAREGLTNDDGEPQQEADTQTAAAPSMVLLEDEAFLSGAESTPWFIKGMYGFSAWLAMLTTAAFLLMLGIFESKIAMIALGLCALVISTNAMRKQIDSIFASQTMLALSLVGQMLLIVGIGKGSSQEGFYAIVLVIELGLIFANSDKIHRFFSTIFASTACFSLAKSIPLGLNVAAGLWALGCAYLWLPQLVSQAPRWSHKDTAPIRYGLAISLLGLLGLSSAPKLAGSLQINTWAPAAVFLVVILGWVGLHLMKTHNAPWTNENKIIAITLGVLSLAAFNAPGVLAAGLLFLLATEKRDRILQWLSIICFAWYMSALYYNLSISLLLKSIALLVPGLGLLVLRHFYLRQAEAQTTPDMGETSHAH